jgi:hypothetical protein
MNKDSLHATFPALIDSAGLIGRGSGPAREFTPSTPR